jgi:hypothetical protein
MWLAILQSLRADRVPLPAGHVPPQARQPLVGSCQFNADASRQVEDGLLRARFS